MTVFVIFRGIRLDTSTCITHRSTILSVPLQDEVTQDRRE